MLVTQGAIIAALMGIVPTALAQELSHGAMGFEGKVLLKTTRTANNKPATLPSGGTAEITSMLISIEPGGHSSLHSHPVPVIAYVLEGSLETRFEGAVRSYKVGEAVVEPMNTPMQAVNPGESPTKLLVVFVGQQGTPNSVAVK